MIEQYSSILFYLLGGLASLGFITSNYALRRSRILILQTLGSIAVGLQFIVVDIWSVALVNLIFIIRNIILFFRENYLSKNNRVVSSRERIRFGSLLFAILLATYFVVNGLPIMWDFEALILWSLPLLAGIFNIIAIAQANVRTLKIFILFSVSCWAVFDVITSAWTTLIGDTFSMIACLIAIVRLSKNKV